MTLDLASMEALAPDAGTLKRARGLAGARKWSLLGRSDQALWGVLAGRSYQTQVALDGLVPTCTCPVRRPPCKHALALLLLAAGQPDAVAPVAPPPWVEDWLAKRQARAERREARAAASARPADPAARAARRQERHANMQAGAEGLHHWLQDRVREGLGSLGVEARRLFAAQAARLVDAQTPGLARRVSEMGALPGSGQDGWLPELLAEMGRCALLCHAFARFDALPEALQHELRRLLGQPLREPEVRAAGDSLHDRWCVLGRVEEVMDARLSQRRTWLLGLQTGQWALHLDFKVMNAPYKAHYRIGKTFEAELHFWPGAVRRRALVPFPVELQEPQGVPAGVPHLEAMLEQVAASLARQPFQRRFGVCIEALQLVPGDRHWTVRDRQQRGLPLARGDYWQLLARSGGQPLTLACEWDGRALLPLAAACDGALQPVRRENL